jgi:hypothetical protein
LLQNAIGPCYDRIKCILSLFVKYRLREVKTIATINDMQKDLIEKKRGHAPMNGIQTYYEIHGTGQATDHDTPLQGLCERVSYADQESATDCRRAPGT